MSYAKSSCAKDLSFLKPIGRILVSSHMDAEKIGTLVVPAEHSQQKCMIGHVIAIGLSVHNQNEVSISDLELSQGDYVLYQNWAGVELNKDKDQTYHLLKPVDILAIISEADIAKYKQFKGGHA